MLYRPCTACFERNIFKKVNLVLGTNCKDNSKPYWQDEERYW